MDLACLRTTKHVHAQAVEFLQFKAVLLQIVVCLVADQLFARAVLPHFEEVTPQGWRKADTEHINMGKAIEGSRRSNVPENEYALELLVCDIAAAEHCLETGERNQITVELYFNASAELHPWKYHCVKTGLSAPGTNIQEAALLTKLGNFAETIEKSLHGTLRVLAIDWTRATLSQAIRCALDYLVDMFCLVWNDHMLHPSPK